MTPPTVWTLSWWTKPGARRADIDALQLVFGGDPTLGVLGDLALHLAELLHRFGPHLFIDLNHLERCFGNAAFRLGDGGNQLPPLAFDAGPVALERVETRELHEVLLVEFAHALELLGDQGGLAGFRGLLGTQSRDLVLRLRDPLFELILLRVARGATSLEQGALGAHDLGDRRIVQAVGEFGRRRHRRRAVPLRFEAGLAGDEFVELLRHDLEVGARHRLVEAHQQFALADPLAFAHVQLADDAAGSVLDLLDAGIDHELAARHDGAGQGRGAGPQADGAAEQGDHRDADDRRPADGRLMLRPLRGLAGSTLSDLPQGRARRCPRRNRSRRRRGVTFHDRLQDFVARAESLDAALLHDADEIHVAEGGGAVGDDDHDAAAFAHRQNGAVQGLVAGAVEAGIGLVEDDQEGIAVERTGERHALALAAREGRAAFADMGVVPVGQCRGSAHGRPPSGRP